MWKFNPETKCYTTIDTLKNNFFDCVDADDKEVYGNYTYHDGSTEQYSTVDNGYLYNNSKGHQWFDQHDLMKGWYKEFEPTNQTLIFSEDWYLDGDGDYHYQNSDGETQTVYESGYEYYYYPSGDYEYFDTSDWYYYNSTTRGWGIWNEATQTYQATEEVPELYSEQETEEVEV